MRKFVFSVLILLLVSFQSFAKGFIGGDFSLKHHQGNEYILTLYLYFDDLDGNIESIDDSVIVGMFERGGTFVNNIPLPKITESMIQPANATCESDYPVRTLIYSEYYTFDTDVYSNAQGYRFVYDRCCRSNQVDNIQNSSNAGMALYLDVPSFIDYTNSSPEFLAPFTEYACTDYGFTYNMSAREKDNDSRVYSIVPCKNGHTDALEQIISDYTNYSALVLPNVLYTSGQKGSDPIPAVDQLVIDKNGLINFTPSDPGTYVFAVLCEEYRNGVKLGETIRDYRLIVQDCVGDDTVCVPDGTNKQVSGVRDEKVKKNEPVVYPNPFVDNVTISMKNRSSDAQVKVFTLQGTKVKSFDITGKLKGEFTVNLDELQRGVYLLQVSTDYGVSTHKIIKE